MEDSPDEDLEQLLALSAAIVIKLRLGGLDDKKKKRFATIFRKIASKIEAETVVNGSFWDALWVGLLPGVFGASPNPKPHLTALPRGLPQGIPGAL